MNFFFRFTYYMCIHVLSTCVSVSQICAWCPWRLEEGVRFPGTGGRDACEPEPSFGCSGPLQEHKCSQLLNRLLQHPTYYVFNTESPGWGRIVLLVVLSCLCLLCVPSGLVEAAIQTRQLMSSPGLCPKHGVHSIGELCHLGEMAQLSVFDTGVRV